VHGLDEIRLHGRRLAYRRRAGDGPAVLLIHGITNDSATWAPVVAALGEDHDVIAPDLPGHGSSERQRGDHSLAAHANRLRDLLTVLEVERVTVVGHSLGGGVVLQLAYQYPELVQRIVLVSSGGLGREVSLLIRAAALPFAEQALGVLAVPGVRGSARLASAGLERLGLRPGPDVTEIGRGLGSLADAERRAAFVRTVRSVVSTAGQRVSATDRLYLAATVPTLLVWGARDRVIPAAHAEAAHTAIPGSRLEVFPQAGHFPQLDDPGRFAALLSRFIEEVPAAEFDRARIRRHLVDGPGR
jgi:pimeloyl-ACP methyl ester carboxylesterase